MTTTTVPDRRAVSGPGRVTLVVHGPEPFDRGDVATLARVLRPRDIIVCGAMGRTAAGESGVRFRHDPRPPSAVLRDTTGDAVLVNHGKTPRSGWWFGNLVALRLGGHRLVHAECSDRVVRSWGHPVDDLTRALAMQIGFGITGEIPVEPPGKGIRRIHGYIPGEPVLVNGIVIGRATAETVTLAMKEGMIVPVSGLDPKPHGLDKIHRRGMTDLAVAWCKSGCIRNRPPERSRAVPVPQGHAGTLAVADHCGHRLYDRVGPGTCGILAVGDDTTAACSHIGTRLSLPVIGIMDGDGDGLVCASFTDGSVLVIPLYEKDDDAGDEAAQLVDGTGRTFEEWKHRIITHFGDRVRVVVPGKP